MTWNHDITAAPRGEEKKTVVQILKEARALIADEKNWTKGEYARNRKGYAVAPESGRAVCFCSIGAIRAVSDEPRFARAATDTLSDVGGCSVADFNDHHTHAEVIALFDRAIARAESEEGGRG